ncbi:hypothetical protein BDB00DRAFT_878380 [Zychaea mexicana]|uniref:uncharacterized protein n=1 Tax=Zychaea mexicana TaxID=64656 RepID=UPI0022FE492D|nr:uncharacterized protein BDB00DRAFT_878380 [Zychaea mexicana]KAI9484823.1 hypothetical protein BDB00DRAFT_878380 [Zychaea mexicana]
MATIQAGSTAFYLQGGNSSWRQRKFYQESLEQIYYRFGCGSNQAQEAIAAMKHGGNATHLTINTGNKASMERHTCDCLTLDQEISHLVKQQWGQKKEREAHLSKTHQANTASKGHYQQGAHYYQRDPTALRRRNNGGTIRIRLSNACWRAHVEDTGRTTDKCYSTRESVDGSCRTGHIFKNCALLTFAHTYCLWQQLDR